MCLCIRVGTNHEYSMSPWRQRVIDYIYFHSRVHQESTDTNNRDRLLARIPLHTKRFLLEYARRHIPEIFQAALLRKKRIRRNMRPKEIENQIGASLERPREAPPLFIEGPPGVGKSAVARQAADRMNEKFIEEGIEPVEGRAFGWLDTRASQHDPTDFRGIPAVINNRAVWLPPVDIPFEGNLNIPERGLWFLDEITSAPPLVQAVLYQAVLDNTIGEHKLKKGWYIIAAGNRIEDRAVTYRMPSALANRFSHINFEVNLEDWTEWATNNNINPEIISFLHFKPELLFAFNPESSEKAFCSPRTWEYASRHIDFSPKDNLRQILEGTIGKGATAEFTAFLRLQHDLPDINTIFEGNNYVPDQLDLKYALVGALAQRAEGTQMFERLLEYSKHLDTELAVLLVTMLAYKNKEALARSSRFKKWATSNAALICTN